MQPVLQGAFLQLAGIGWHPAFFIEHGQVMLQVQTVVNAGYQPLKVLTPRAQIVVTQHFAHPFTLFGKEPPIEKFEEISTRFNRFLQGLLKLTELAGWQRGLNAFTGKRLHHNPLMIGQPQQILLFGGHLHQGGKHLVHLLVAYQPDKLLDVLGPVEDFQTVFKLYLIAGYLAGSHPYLLFYFFYFTQKALHLLQIADGVGGKRLTLKQGVIRLAKAQGIGRIVADAGINRQQISHVKIAVQLLEVHSRIAQVRGEVKLLGRQTAFLLIIQGSLEFLQLFGNLIYSACVLQKTALQLQGIEAIAAGLVKIYMLDLPVDFLIKLLAVILKVMHQAKKIAHFQLFKALIHHIQGSPFLANQQHPLAACHVVGHQVADNLRLAGARRPLDNQRVTFLDRFNGIFLIGIHFKGRIGLLFLYPAQKAETVSG